MHVHVQGDEASSLDEEEEGEDGMEDAPTDGATEQQQPLPPQMSTTTTPAFSVPGETLVPLGTTGQQRAPIFHQLSTCTRVTE